MKHYDYIEWLLYKSKALPDEKLKEMEEHLYGCNICLDIFLSLVDEKGIELATSIVPKDFTEKVIKNISDKKVKIVQPTKKNKPFNYQLSYFAAVASVTIILTLGGFYTNMVDAVPKITDSIYTMDMKSNSNLISNFSNGIVNSTSNILNSIENVDKFKEESNER